MKRYWIALAGIGIAIVLNGCASQPKALTVEEVQLENAPVIHAVPMNPSAVHESVRLNALRALEMKKIQTKVVKK